VHSEISPVRLNDGGDDEGALVFIDGKLTAVLSRLGPGHGEREGRWNIEHTFALEVPGSPVFKSPQDACDRLVRLLEKKRAAEKQQPGNSGSGEGAGAL
jgi:hypothetical protein